MERNKIIQLLKSENPDSVTLGLLLAEQWNDTELLKAYHQLRTFGRSVGVHSIGVFFGDWWRMIYTDEREGNKALHELFKIDDTLIKNVFGLRLLTKNQSFYRMKIYTAFLKHT